MVPAVTAAASRAARRVANRRRFEYSWRDIMLATGQHLRCVRHAFGLTRGVLLAVMLAAVVIADGHLLHVHRADDASLYNEQHVFEGAAGLGTAAPVPSAPETGAIAAVATTAPPEPQPAAPAPTVRAGDPRAPPSA